MAKKYVVRLTDAERIELTAVVRKLAGTSPKLKRAMILLKADADGPGWTDEKIAEAFSCRTRTIETLRQRLVESGFAETLHGKPGTAPPVAQKLDGEQETKVVALRWGAGDEGRRAAMGIAAEGVCELVAATARAAGGGAGDRVGDQSRNGATDAEKTG